MPAELQDTGGAITRTQAVRIVIAGEHPIFLEGLRRLIETQPAFVTVATGASAPALVSEFAPDILLLALGNGSPSVASTIQEIALTAPAVRTIVLTNSVDTPCVSRALESGVRAVVPKDSPPDALFKSIECVMAGRYWIGGELPSDAVPSLRQLETSRRQDKAFGLTRRELEILRCIVGGHTNKEIAERSSISENTVKCHLTHIFNKLGASNRVELALFAAHHRLLDGI